MLDGAAFEGETGRPYGPWIDALRKLPNAPGVADARETAAPCSLRMPMHIPARARGCSRASSTRSPHCARPAHRCWWCSTTCTGSTRARRSCCITQRACSASCRCCSCSRRAKPSSTTRPPCCACCAACAVTSSVREIALARLPEAATHELVRTVDRAADASQLFAQSAGNPLFALELARAGAVARRVRARGRGRARSRRALAGRGRRGVALGCGVGLGDRRPQLLRCAVEPAARSNSSTDSRSWSATRCCGSNRAQSYVFSHEVVRSVDVQRSVAAAPYADAPPRGRSAVQAAAAEPTGEYDEGAVALIARHAALGEDARARRQRLRRRRLAGACGCSPATTPRSGAQRHAPRRANSPNPSAPRPARAARHAALGAAARKTPKRFAEREGAGRDRARARRGEHARLGFTC